MSCLLGIVARETRAFSRCLRDGPRSLEVLGREHSDGWRIAVHESAIGWSIVKRPTSASSDPAYVATVAGAHGSLLLAHVRRRTVGGVSPDNTHPFRHGDWVFAHNGTIDRVAELRTALDDASVATIRGETDSEVLFAFLMARLAPHPSAKCSRFITDMVLARAVEDLASIPSLGAATFLLSDGVVLYAYCQGRPLSLLERRADSHTEAILVASEPVTSDEPWTSIAEGTLLAVWRRPYLGWGAMRDPPIHDSVPRGSASSEGLATGNAVSLDNAKKDP